MTNENDKIINWVCQDLIVREMITLRKYNSKAMERALDLAINKSKREGIKAERERLLKLFKNTFTNDNLYSYFMTQLEEIYITHKTPEEYRTRVKELQNKIIELKQEHGVEND